MLSLHYNAVVILINHNVILHDTLSLALTVAVLSLQLNLINNVIRYCYQC